MAKFNPAFLPAEESIQTETGLIQCVFHATVVSFHYANLETLTSSVADSVRRYAGIPFDIQSVEVSLQEDDQTAEFHMEDPNDVPSLEWTGNVTVTVISPGDRDPEEILSEIVQAVLAVEDFRDDSGQFRWMSLSPENL